MADVPGRSSEKIPRTVIDLFIVRRGDSGPEILLVGGWRRDPNQQGRVRMACGFKRSGETTRDCIRRIADSSLGAQVEYYMLLGHCSDPHDPGGHKEHQVYLVELKGAPEYGNWYVLGHLPTNVMERYLPIIHDGLEVYAHFASPGFDRDYAGVAEHEERLAHFARLREAGRVDPDMEEHFAPYRYWQREINDVLAARGWR
jgi:ADP-ribose pyrophosphatase YjhB (NUDIX family)